MKHQLHHTVYIHAGGPSPKVNVEIFVLGVHYFVLGMHYFVLGVHDFSLSCGAYLEMFDG